MLLSNIQNLLTEMHFSPTHKKQHVYSGPLVSFSSCQRNLMKTFQIEGMIALITKVTLIFSSDLLNGQK